MLKMPSEHMDWKFLLLLIFACGFTASGKISAQEQEPKQEQVQAAKSVAEVLGETPNFEQLQKLFDARYEAWMRLMVAQQEDEKAEWVPPPINEFFHYYQRAAKAGEADAMIWILVNSYMGNVPRQELRELKLHCVKSLAELAGEKKYLKAVASALMNDWDPETAIPWSTGDQILRQLFANVKKEDKETRALLLYARFNVHDKRQDKMADALAIQILKTLGSDFAETKHGKTAVGLLFNKQHLQIGMRAPNFVGQDVDGNDISLSNYKGKVVYLVFWGFW